MKWFQPFRGACNESEVEIEDTRISMLFGFFGKFTFMIAVILSIAGIVIVMIGKYNSQKLHWGIYMSLGMNKRQVMKFLGLELLIYAIIGSSVSLLLFLLIAFAQGHQYPLSQYMFDFLMSVCFVGSLLFIGIYFIKRTINKKSIFQLLRRDD
ncbi:FtsX-like permease family protein [Ureibacillus terrenus]|uniref:FtsX-like permease family protein n=1 Tax=Ureibacillus terrenus TaxID=118246 RepID=UPI002E2087C6|nr:FtsX-like permease family protein [Ureibacillus terrenus]